MSSVKGLGSIGMIPNSLAFISWHLACVPAQCHICQVHILISSSDLDLCLRRLLKSVLGFPINISNLVYPTYSLSPLLHKPAPHPYFQSYLMIPSSSILFSHKKCFIFGLILSHPWTALILNLLDSSFKMLEIIISNMVFPPIILKPWLVPSSVYTVQPESYSYIPLVTTPTTAAY